MATVTELSPPLSHEEELAPYRAVSRSAVVSVILAVICMPLVGLAIVSSLFRFGDAVQVGLLGGALAIPAVLLGFSGWRSVLRYPEEYTGGGLARFGCITGIGLMLGGFAAASYTYATEVPEGHLRVGFWELQPDPDRPELYPIGPKALEFHEKKIFIKGYMHPGVASSGKVEYFILVPDMGTCCFGGQPKPTDMIAVHVPDAEERPSYSTHKLSLAGTFALADRPMDGIGLKGVWYHLQAKEVR
jgi:hypothetical protein